MLSRLLKYILTAAVICSLLCGAAAAYSAEEPRVQMPAIEVELSDAEGRLASLPAGDISASIDGVSVAVLGLERAERGILYVYMIDVSGSMPADSFAAAVQAVRGGVQRLREQDILALITFGDEVKTVLHGGETPEQALSALDALSCTDRQTCFHDALYALVELASGHEDMLALAVMVSDGADDSDTEVSGEDAAEKLMESGVVLCGLCPEAASEADSAAFAELAEATGGSFVRFSASDASEAMDGLLAAESELWTLKLDASEVTGGRTAKLMLNVAGEELVCTVTLDQYAPPTPVPATPKPTVAPAPTAEPRGGPGDAVLGEIESLAIWIGVAAAVLILGVVAVVLVLRKRGGKKADKEPKEKKTKEKKTKLPNTGSTFVFTSKTDKKNGKE